MIKAVALLKKWDILAWRKGEVNIPNKPAPVRGWIPKELIPTRARTNMITSIAADKTKLATTGFLRLGELIGKI